MSAKFKLKRIGPNHEQCVCCDKPGTIQWQGEPHCHLHCPEEARIANLIWRLGTVGRQLAGDEYTVTVKIEPKQRDSLSNDSPDQARADSRLGDEPGLEAFPALCESVANKGENE